MRSTPFKSLPAAVWILAGSQALALSEVPMMLLVSGLLAAKIAPNEKLATLPVALIIVGTACSTFPAAMAMRRLGRKRGGFLGLAAGLLACLCGFQAARGEAFGFLLLASLLLGVSLAFGQQFRFAALESVGDPANYGPALSLFMTGGLIAAFVGPEVGALGRDWIASPHGFAGSFVILAGVILCAAGLFSLYREAPPASEREVEAPRPLLAILRAPAFLLAASVAATSYIVMSFVMTATPITMYEICGFTLDQTKRVIQSHIVAMYLPSLFSGWLMNRFGPGRLMLAGVVAYAAALVVGLQGRELMHFWGSLVLLGIGWNFLFASGTALLPASYRPCERFKVQASNDLVVFGSQAVASLSAGWYLYSFSWNALLLSCGPFLLLAAGLAARRCWSERVSTAG